MPQLELPDLDAVLAYLRYFASGRGVGNDWHLQLPEAKMLLAEIDRLRALVPAPPMEILDPDATGLPPEFVGDLFDPTDPAMPRW